MMRILGVVSRGKTARNRPGSTGRLLLLALLGGVLLVSLTGCTLWTVRSLHPAAGTAGAPLTGGIEPGKPGFSAVAYVDSIWQSKVLPTVQERGTDLPTLLAALKADPAAAKQAYGHREGQRPYNFLVKGTGKVLTVDTSSRSGTIKVDLVPEDGTPDATIQVGPVLRGTSLRDALPFIQFNMFTNQLEYADVSNQLSDRVLKDTIGTLDVPGLQGKTVTFQGAYTLDESGSVLITPVLLQAK
jgi:predicted lipoprotein